MKMISKFFNIILFSLTLSSVFTPIIAQSSEASPEAININTASAEVIANTLKGVGISKAKAIVQFRETYGDFAHIEELVEVKGIGKSTIAKNIERITLGTNE